MIALHTADERNVPDKSRIVEEGNYHKFTNSKSNPGMAKKLLDTGDRELVEVVTLGFSYDKLCTDVCVGLARRPYLGRRIWSGGGGAAS